MSSGLYFWLDNLNMFYNRAQAVYINVNVCMHAFMHAFMHVFGSSPGLFVEQRWSISTSPVPVNGLIWNFGTPRSVAEAISCDVHDWRKANTARFPLIAKVI